jgi:diguanylate cyclase (GGDEF)-like protein
MLMQSGSQCGHSYSTSAEEFRCQTTRMTIRAAVRTEAAHVDNSELARARKELRTLYAALDNVESGLLVLDSEFRAVYSNPVLHRIFKSHSPEEIRSRKPLYEELLRAAYTASAVHLDDYVATRLAWVRSGDATPMDLKMTSGTVLRCHLAVLPDGGRMLIYSDVTDIVRQAQELERLATTDGMTGIYNRRHFLALADLEWSRACRYSRPLSFLIFDIDYFKNINDTFGHHAGDEVIIHLANLAGTCKRAPDVLARIGGEEFALLLPETDLSQAQVVAERLRVEIASHPLVLASQRISTTISIGIAARTSETSGISELMTTADRALYEAKRGGRNRIMCSLLPGDAPPTASSAQLADPDPVSASELPER